MTCRPNNVRLTEKQPMGGASAARFMLGLDSRNVVPAACGHVRVCKRLAESGKYGKAWDISCISGSMAVENAMLFPDLVKNPSSGAALLGDAMPV